MVIRLAERESLLTLEVPSGHESILQILSRNGVNLPAPCGGKGKCGKCRIRVLEGRLPVTEEDRKTFHETEDPFGRTVPHNLLASGAFCEILRNEEKFWIFTGTT